MDECKYLLTFIASNKNNKNTAVIQFLYSLLHIIPQVILYAKWNITRLY